MHTGSPVPAGWPTRSRYSAFRYRPCWCSKVGNSRNSGYRSSNPRRASTIPPLRTRKICVPQSSARITADNAAEYLRLRGFAPHAVRISELGGGVSNTVLLVETAERRFVLKQALGKLRVKDDWFSDRRRIFREAAAMQWLAPHLAAGSLPEIIFEDRQNCLFAMSAAPREAETWKSLLLRGSVEVWVAETIARMLA